MLRERGLVVVHPLLLCVLAASGLVACVREAKVPPGPPRSMNIDVLGDCFTVARTGTKASFRLEGVRALTRTEPLQLMVSAPPDLSAREVSTSESLDRSPRPILFELTDLPEQSLSFRVRLTARTESHEQYERLLESPCP